MHGRADLLSTVQQKHRQAALRGIASGRGAARPGADHHQVIALAWYKAGSRTWLKRAHWARFDAFTTRDAAFMHLQTGFLQVERIRRTNAYAASTISTALRVNRDHLFRTQQEASGGLPPEASWVKRRLLFACLDINDRIGYLGDLLRVFIGDLATELFLKGHDHFYEIERISF